CIIKDNNYSIDSKNMLVTILDTIKSAYAASESKIALKYHLELVKEAEIDKAKENIKELQKEMSEACFKVIQTRKYFLWKGTIALPVMPFDIEVDQNAYFILSIYSDDIEFNNKDIDFF